MFIFRPTLKPPTPTPPREPLPAAKTALRAQCILVMKTLILMTQHSPKMLLGVRYAVAVVSTLLRNGVVALVALSLP